MSQDYLTETFVPFSERDCILSVLQIFDVEVLGPERRFEGE